LEQIRLQPFAEDKVYEVSDGMACGSRGSVLDLEATHLSFALYGGRPDIKDVPAVARNVEIWAFPGSLTQVMK